MNGYGIRKNQATVFRVSIKSPGKTVPVILKVINMCQLTQTLNGHLKLLMSNFVYTYLPYIKFITRGSFEPFLIFHNTEKIKKKENSSSSLLIGLNLVFLFNPILLEKDIYQNIIDIKKNPVHF